MTKKEIEAELQRINVLLALRDTGYYTLMAEITALLFVVEEMAVCSAREQIMKETARDAFFRYRVRELERLILKVGDTDPRHAEEMQKIVERWRKLPGGADKF